LRAEQVPINFSSILLLWWKLAQSQWIALFFGRRAAPLLIASSFLLQRKNRPPVVFQEPCPRAASKGEIIFPSHKVILEML
jgi:hypothetical protein